MYTCGSRYHITTSFIIAISIESLTRFLWRKRCLLFNFNTLIDIICETKRRSKDLPRYRSGITLLNIILLMICNNLRL